MVRRTLPGEMVRRLRNDVRCDCKGNPLLAIILTAVIAGLVFPGEVNCVTICPCKANVPGHDVLVSQATNDLQARVSKVMYFCFSRLHKNFSRSTVARF